ncbi:unnamed protein product [Pleuronectes platessa]|uniref:Uncharacterized protein n=1 Tax=Pleuronectes platessa TaxID=8262 RepID=A0A9N7U677_PLEPL|nr:unnamed protein product [Pleuronectes platessa]
MEGERGRGGEEEEERAGCRSDEESTQRIMTVEKQRGEPHTHRSIPENVSRPPLTSSRRSFLLLLSFGNVFISLAFVEIDVFRINEMQEVAPSERVDVWTRFLTRDGHGAGRTQTSQDEEEEESSRLLLLYRPRPSPGCSPHVPVRTSRTQQPAAAAASQTTTTGNVPLELIVTVEAVTLSHFISQEIEPTGNPDGPISQQTTPTLSPVQPAGNCSTMCLCPGVYWSLRFKQGLSHRDGGIWSLRLDLELSLYWDKSDPIWTESGLIQIDLESEVGLGAESILGRVRPDLD